MSNVGYPVIPVRLVFSDIVPKVFDKNPVTSLNPTVRFRAKRISVNSLYSEQFAGFFFKDGKKISFLDQPVLFQAFQI